MLDSGEAVLDKLVYTLNSDGTKATETDFHDAGTTSAMTYAWTYDGIGRLTGTTVNFALIGEGL